jgi:hypothetical protein
MRTRRCRKVRTGIPQSSTIEVHLDGTRTSESADSLDLSKWHDGTTQSIFLTDTEVRMVCQVDGKEYTNQRNETCGCVVYVITNNDIALDIL